MYSKCKFIKIPLMILYFFDSNFVLLKLGLIHNF